MRLEEPERAIAPGTPQKDGPEGAGPTGPALALERLEVRRMPGFRQGGFTLDGLSPGINVIYGPNGAGKSTTARAIEALLWPAEVFQPQDALFGRLRLAGETWTVELDGHRRIWQRQGRPAERPAFPGELARRRYRFSLTELLQVNDHAFAGQIVRESAGGYDVAQAAQRLGFGQRPGGHQKAANQLEAARDQVERARQEQQELRAAEERLTILEAGKAEAAAAAERAEQLDRLVELAESQAEEAQRRQALGPFPAWMRRLAGDEAERLTRMEAGLRQAEAERQAADKARQQARDDREALGLPEAGVPLDQIQTLRERQAHLEERERECRDLGRQVVRAEAALEEEARRLGGAVEPGRLATLDREAMNALQQAAHEGQELEQERKSLLAQRARLASEDQPPDEDRLRMGLDLLSRWLRTPAPEASGRGVRQAVWVALAAVGVMLAGVGLAGTAPLVALVASGAGLVVAWWVARLLFRPREDGRAGLAAQYRELGLGEPGSWTDAGVEQARDRLLAQLAQVKEFQYRRERHQELSKQFDDLEAEWQAWRRGWEELVASLGLPQGLPHASAVWLAERIGAWQSAQARLEEARAALRKAEEEREELLAQQAAELAPYGYTGLTTREALAGALAGLEERRVRWEQARQEEREALQRARSAAAEASRLNRERRELFQRLDLDPDDPQAEAAVRQAVANLDRYRALYRKWDEASWRVKRAQEQVAALGQELDDLSNASLDELRLAREEARRRAADEEELHDEITRTRDRIEQAKAAHDLEEALAQEDAAREQVLDAFRREAASQLGAWLAGLVQAESRDSERPQVFHRARELLHALTRGRYTLELDDSEEPAFRALETATGEGRALDELSSGTRVQLLLAVRVAFVETQEQGARLPLIFDEVLANSDDERARAVMEAVVALARQGRQIFYFTAQMDEVSKWQAVLGEAGVPFRLLDLERLKQQQEADLRPLPPAAPARRPVPAPEGESYAEYGQRLQVPSILPDPDALGQVHLWHLLDDGEDLHRLLNLGLERWGQLQALGEGELEAMVPGRGRRLHRQAGAAARVLQAVVENWRIGRGRPVDGPVLEASGAVSNRFLEGATDLARAVGGDARRLLEALEGGQLRHFRQEKLADLRDYLRDQGYLDEREPLPFDVLLARAMAAAAADLGAGLITREHVERLVATVAATG